MNVENEPIHFNITFLLCLKADSENFRSALKDPFLEKTCEDSRSLKIGDFIATLRIEYELIPKRFRYSVDVTCWRNVAKISVPNACCYFRTLQSGYHIWVPIPLHHFLKELTENELIDLRSNIIVFNVTTTRKEISSNVSYVYCAQNEANEEEFVEYFDTDPRKTSSRCESTDGTDKLVKSITKCLESGSSSCVKLTGKAHPFFVYDTISSISNGEEVRYKHFSSSDLQTNKKTEYKQNTKKSEEKKENSYFIVPGEVFFTDPSISTYKLKDGNDLLSSGYIFLSVENLMKKEQIASLNPLVIKINKLESLPVDILHKNGFSRLFISYDIPFLTLYDSPTKPIEKIVYFNESHIFFLKDLPKYKYLEYLRTKRVKVHIKGIRDEENQKQPKLFGTLKEDENFNKCFQPRYAFHYLRKRGEFERTQTLAIATYDLSSLLKNIWTFRLAAPCFHPENEFDCEIENMETFVDVLTIPEVNLAGIDKNENSSPLSDDILASHVTTLDMEFSFLCQQPTSYHLSSNITTYKRFFIIFFDLDQAKHLLAAILQHNQNLIGLNAIIADPVNVSEDKVKLELRKRKLSKQEQVSDESLKRDLKEMIYNVDDVITGFTIDNGTEVYVFVEGISHGFILEVWNRIHKVNVSDARVFLNSELEFENRIYGYFVSFGLYTITLKKSLKKIFEDQSIYVRGLVPIPCSRALQKLQLLLRTETLNDMLLHELFPSSKELISLNIELGVPLRIYSSV